MKSRIIALAVFAVASTAALAQSGPDFSPMKPRGFDEARTESLSPQPDTRYSQPATPGENRMLDAYESSALQVPAETNEPSVYASPYEEIPRDGVVILEGAPRQDTIGNGLFNRRGPNDFGA